MVGAIIGALAARAFRFANEEELQMGIAEALTADGIAFAREERLDEASRIDFLVGDVGIEVKTDGSLTALTRQLMRYAERAEIARLVLVTSQRRLTNMPPSLNGKPLTVVTISRGFQ